MIIKTKELQDLCKIILGAVDGSSTGSIVSETLELKILNSQLLMSVTNREYFVTVKMNIDNNDILNCVVDASLFLNLIAKITSEDIELIISNNYLEINANGKYKLPFIIDNNGPVTLEPIILENKTLEFDINTSILNSIVQYNTKELSSSKKLSISSPVQKLYYIDEQGAITFTTGACVNEFTLEKPVKMLLNAKIIKLFNLFKSASVRFSLGHDQLSNTGQLQTKICLEDAQVKIVSIILNDDTMLASVPVSAIRGRANNMYKYNININKDDLLQSINRLMLFSSKDRKSYNIFEFGADKVTIYDSSKESSESISYSTTTLQNLQEPYNAVFDLQDIKIAVENCVDKYLNISFGDNQAVVVSRGNIKNIIPEVMMS